MYYVSFVGGDSTLYVLFCFGESGKLYGETHSHILVFLLNSNLSAWAIHLWPSSQNAHNLKPTWTQSGGRDGGWHRLIQSKFCWRHRAIYVSFRGGGGGNAKGAVL